MFGQPGRLELSTISSEWDKDSPSEPLGPVLAPPHRCSAGTRSWSCSAPTELQGPEGGGGGVSGWGSGPQRRLGREHLQPLPGLLNRVLPAGPVSPTRFLGSGACTCGTPQLRGVTRPPRFTSQGNGEVDLDPLVRHSVAQQHGGHGWRRVVLVRSPSLTHVHAPAFSEPLTSWAPGP